MSGKNKGGDIGDCDVAVSCPDVMMTIGTLIPIIIRSAEILTYTVMSMFFCTNHD